MVIYIREKIKKHIYHIISYLLYGFSFEMPFEDIVLIEESTGEKIIIKIL